MKNECGIPHRLPAWTMEHEPTNNYIAQFLPARLGGKQKHVMSAKDYDRDLRAYRTNMIKGKPIIKHTPGPKDGRAHDLAEIVRRDDFEENQWIRIQQQPQFQDVFMDDKQYRHPPPPDLLYVAEWVDYSAKQGIGYRLSTDVLGVTFNDRSKLVLDNDMFHFSYFAPNVETLEP